MKKDFFNRKQECIADQYKNYDTCMQKPVQHCFYNMFYIYYCFEIHVQKYLRELNYKTYLEFLTLIVIEEDKIKRVIKGQLSMLFKQ